jgi:hypothetical protein
MVIHRYLGAMRQQHNARGKKQPPMCNDKPAATGTQERYAAAGVFESGRADSGPRDSATRLRRVNLCSLPAVG